MNNINQNKSLVSNRQVGFTIVELMVVIVIIGILAAITAVSFSGLTNRANTATAKSNATSVKQVAEAYAADSATGATGGGNGYFGPLTAVAPNPSLTAYKGVTTLPAGVSVVGTQLVATTAGVTDGKVIQYVPKGTAPNFTGACLGYWDSTVTPAAAAYLYSGDAKTGTNAAIPTCV